MIKRLLAGVLLLLAAAVSAQKNTLTINLTDRTEDEQFTKSMAIVPVYKYTSPQIEPYTMFGVDPPENQTNLEIKTLPDMKGMTDTAYSFIYFSGSDNQTNQGYLLTILGNYRRSVRTIYFWTDKNNNFDFTDDGPPDSMKYHDREVVIHLNNQANPQANYMVKLSRLEYGENVQYKNLLTEHYKKHSGKKVFTDINYCYREQRYNCLAADYRNGNDSFRIALKDLNINGLFNESCLDKIAVGPFGKQVSTEEMQFILPDVKYNSFEWNKKKYTVVSISPDGKSVSLSVSEPKELQNQLKTGKKIPAFTFKNIAGKKEKIRSYRGQPVYIYFWDKNHLPKEDSLYLRLINADLSANVKLVTLNHGDAPKSVYLIKYYDKISWPMGFSSGEIGKAYYLEETPRGYLADKKQRLLNDKLSPQQVYEKYSKQ